MCMLLALLIHSGCLPPPPRPLYQDLWTVYGPTPDCGNKEAHIHYLTSLKQAPLRTGDTVTVAQYNQALDMYVERMQWYCESHW
jgi:hypothetical protein